MDAVWYTVTTDRSKKFNFRLKKMYKQIQLTDKELQILHEVLGWYLTEKKHQTHPNYTNAHIILRHISGKLTHNNTNQIAFYGK